MGEPQACLVEGPLHDRVGDGVAVEGVGRVVGGERRAGDAEVDVHAGPGAAVDLAFEAVQLAAGVIGDARAVLR